MLPSLDMTITATLSAPLSYDFNPRSATLIPWLAMAYLIPNTAVQPVTRKSAAGNLPAISGRRLSLAASNLFLALVNLIRGLSTNEHTLILGRVLAGIGGGGMISAATFLNSDHTPLRKRGVMQSIANGWYGAGGL